MAINLLGVTLSATSRAPWTLLGVTLRALAQPSLAPANGLLLPFLTMRVPSEDGTVVSHVPRTIPEMVVSFVVIALGASLATLNARRLAGQWKNTAKLVMADQCFFSLEARLVAA